MGRTPSVKHQGKRRFFDESPLEIVFARNVASPEETALKRRWTKCAAESEGK
jgi:hypothetical protein